MLLVSAEISFWVCVCVPGGGGGVRNGQKINVQCIILYPSNAMTDYIQKCMQHQQLSKYAYQIQQ